MGIAKKEEEPDPNYRTILVEGTAEQVALGKKLVEDVIFEAKRI